eukprot:TRINITY_DN2575_c0_g1_i1.p1 TRINITY_DN2575_c0_g1~~TRINITY_DN2575_c0_g1_i1.p1  ORF type:complete len:372 (-),score=50.65 TRINITY_DN2575_c0_g1_i1:75-1190(-)
MEAFSKGFFVKPRRSLDSEMLRCVAWATLAKFMVYPWERINVVYQVQMLRGPNHQLKTWSQCVDAVKSVGRWALWRGMRVRLMRAIPSYALVLASYAKFTNTYIPDHHNRFPQLDQKSWVASIKIYAAAGAYGGIISTLFTHHFDVLHTRLASDTSNPLRYSSLTHTIVNCFSATDNGFFSIWRGLLPSLLSSMVYRSLQFAGYATTKHALIRSPDQASLLQLTSCALVSSIFAQVLTYPTHLATKIFMLRDELQGDFEYWKKQPPSLVSPTLGIEGEVYWREDLMKKVRSTRAISICLSSQSGGAYKGFIMNLPQVLPFALALAYFDIHLMRKKEKTVSVYPMPPEIDPLDYQKRVEQLTNPGTPSIIRS